MSLRSISTSFWLVLALFGGAAHADTFEKALMPGELTLAHAKYENDCKNCHAKFDKNIQTTLCLDCHKEITKDVSAKAGLHGHLDDKNCRTFHTEHKGRSAQLAVLDKNAFDHNRSGYPLTGAHKAPAVKCSSCHVEKVKYRDTPRSCGACHKKDDQEKGHKGSLGPQCESCHTEISWKVAAYDHEKTRFPLAGGKHAEVKCASCHLDKNYSKTATDCYACHKKDDQEKGHKGRYASKCESCHSDRGWKEIRFNHDTSTRYPLRAKHIQAKCDSCHLIELGPIYHSKISGQCVSCHKKDDQEKGHKGELGEKCASCHKETGWKNSSFNHDETRFPLHDKHRDVKCDACHKGGVSGLKTGQNLKLDRECVACHKKDDQDKGHKGRYGTKCDSCHTEKEWKNASRFSHDRDTAYPLKDKHIAVKCDACHEPEKGALVQKIKLEQACVACHLKDDKHKNQLGSKCEACHNEKRWQDAPFDHNRSRFALTGSHVKTDCKKCHLSVAFHDAPSDCFSCHKKEDMHNGSYGSKCDTCHYTGTWNVWDFNHATTRFKLDGGHADIPCSDCHEPGSPAKISKMCISCHKKEDVHNGGFGVQCEHCHTVVNWKKTLITH